MERIEGQMGQLFFVLLIGAASPAPASYMFCATTSAVPETNNAYITNIFSTTNPAEEVEADFNRYAEVQRYRVTFACQTDRSRNVLQQQYDQVFEEFDDHGYNVVQIQRIK